MQYDKDLVAHKLRRWDKFITDYHLPDWNAIPDLGLYMDQVIVLLEQYLSFIPAPTGMKERFVTSSTINNYVRLKIMPAPVKRKYHRVHIAYLIMILTMKQSLSISDVQKVIPPDSSEEEVRRSTRTTRRSSGGWRCSSTSRYRPARRASAHRGRPATTPWSCWSSRAR